MTLCQRQAQYLKRGGLALLDGARLPQLPEDAQTPGLRLLEVTSLASQAGPGGLAADAGPVIAPNVTDAINADLVTALPCHGSDANGGNYSSCSVQSCSTPAPAAGPATPAAAALA